MSGVACVARTSRSAGTLLGLLVLVAIPCAISAQDVSGTWEVRWAQAIRVNGDGSVEVQSFGNAELALSQDGERVTGTWTNTVRERVQWTVAGTVRGGRLLLEATEHDSTNEELAIVERITWDATVGADGLEGHVALVIRGRARAPALRPFTATPGGNS